MQPETTDECGRAREHTRWPAANARHGSSGAAGGVWLGARSLPRTGPISISQAPIALRMQPGAGNFLNVTDSAYTITFDVPERLRFRPSEVDD